MLDVLDREPGRLAVSAADMEKGGVKAATRDQQKIESRTAGKEVDLHNLYADVAGFNRVPVSTEIARRFSADARDRCWSARSSARR
jgi:hypothetical protein